MHIDERRWAGGEEVLPRRIDVESDGMICRSDRDHGTGPVAVGISNLYLTIHAAGKERAAIGREAKRLDAVGMGIEGSLLLPSRRIPEGNGAVGMSDGEIAGFLCA